MKETINLEYVKKGKTYLGEIDRKEFLSHMEHLANWFPDDNEISTKLKKVIPKMTIIRVNQDVNETQDVPFIQYEEGEQQQINILKIRRNHRIIWSFIQYYCDAAN